MSSATSVAVAKDFSYYCSRATARLSTGRRTYATASGRTVIGVLFYSWTPRAKDAAAAGINREADTASALVGKDYDSKPYTKGFYIAAIHCRWTRKYFCNSVRYG